MAPRGMPTLIDESSAAAMLSSCKLLSAGHVLINQNSCLLSSTRQETYSCLYIAERHHALIVRRTLLGITLHHVLQNMATNGHHYSAIRCLGPSLVRSMCLRQEEIVICALMLPRSAPILSRHHAFSRACQRSGAMHSHQKEPCSALLFCRCAHCVRA